MLVVALLLVIASSTRALIAAVRHASASAAAREPARFAAGRGALRPVGGGAGRARRWRSSSSASSSPPTCARSSRPAPTASAPARPPRSGVKGVPPLRPRLEAEESATGDEAEAGDEQPPAQPLEIDAIAQQWLWRFEYPGGTPEQPHLLLRRAGRPGRHRGDPQHHLDRRPALVVGARRSAARSRRRPARSSRPGSRPTRSAATRAARPSSPAPPIPAMRAWVRVVTVPEYQDYVEQLAAELTEAQEHRRTTDQRGRAEAAPMTPADDRRRRPPRGRHPRGRRRRARPGSSGRPAPTTRSSALLFIGTALTFLALAAVEFALMRVQLIVPENTMIEPEIFNRLLTGAGVTFVVLVRGAAGARADRLHRPAADRRPRRRPAAPRPARLLALRGRRR